MATTTAPPPSDQLDHRELRRFLGALRLQLWWREALVVAALCAGVGAIVGALAVEWPMREAWTDYGSAVALWLTLLGVLAGLAVAAIRRPSVVRAARVADRQLNTSSRLATAAEVLDGRLKGTLANAQLDDAWRTARGIGPWHAYPRGWRRVQLALLGIVASLAVVALALGGVVAPLEVPGLVGGDDSTQQADASDAAAAAAAAADVQDLAADQSTNSAGQAQTLEDLRSQAAQSQAAQTALQKLADSLRSTAAAGDIGNALRAGNYDQAATMLTTLGTESDQLSRISKRELAAAMEKAAIDSAKDDAPLAVSEDRVARALTRGVYTETRDTMQDLAKAVGDAKQGVISQEELARELDQLEKQSQQPQSPGGGGGDIGESEQGYIPDIPGDQPQQTGIVQGVASTISVPGPEGDPNKASHSSVGNEAGGDPFGDLTSQLDVPPVDVNVQAQLGNDQGRNKASPDAPVVKISDTNQNGVRPSDVAQATDPIQAAPEQVVEPTDQRTAVRSFFKSTGDTSGASNATTIPNNAAP
jgi:hypothetical protein